MNVVAPAVEAGAFRLWKSRIAPPPVDTVSELPRPAGADRAASSYRGTVGPATEVADKPRVADEAMHPWQWNGAHSGDVS